jgi:hypothetical protein
MTAFYNTAALRLIADIQTVKNNEDFHSLCRGNNPAAFTRNRKLPLPDLFLAMACCRGITSISEMHVFGKRIGTYDFNVFENRREISGSGYLKARKQFNPDAILTLMNQRLRYFYECGNYLKSDTGDLFLAIDGSKVMLYNNNYTKSHYQPIGRNQTAHNQAGIGVSIVEDTLNGMSMFPLIRDTNFDEIKAAKEQLERITEVIGTIPFIVVMDRGYPSLFFFLFMIDRNIRFIIRLSSMDFKKEQQGMKTDDEEVEIQFTASRISRFKDTPEYERHKNESGLKIRFIRIQLSEDSCEYLATNIFDKEKYPTSVFKQYYHSRWPIEQKYGFLKGSAKLENFSGYLDIMIRQDIYMDVYMSNVLSDLIVEQHEYIETINRSGRYKYEMKIDRALAYGALKEDLAGIWNEKNPEIRFRRIQNLTCRIRSHLLPVRNDRSFERRKGTRAGIYSLTHRPTF